MKKFGYFKPHDPQLPGLRFGNWGSRPYEYFWVTIIESGKDKDILDIGTGLPSEHNWHEFVNQQIQPKSYLGIDFDQRLKNEEINTDNHKVLWMDATNLALPDDSIDLIYSFSTFEHVDNVNIFEQIMKESFRVLRPGGKMVVTLDEYWDWKRQDCLPWNELERAFVRTGKRFEGCSFGMVDFAKEIVQYFTPLDEVPTKINADSSFLYSPTYNDCVSYGVFEVNKK
jgi:SAM-dependent methyltransferase